MTVKEYRTLFIGQLAPIYDVIEAESFFYLILEELRNLRRVDVALDPALCFSADELQKWNKILDQLKKQIPIQYILGSTNFYGLRFTVNRNVLIPRPETEELVQWILDDIEFSTPKTILDIGTGSGCIAISLAKNLPGSSVFALDVSEAALATAGRNAKLNDVHLTFINQNILEVDRLDRKFDIIVSNPPYVRNLEKAEIRPNVMNNEPHLALFVDDDDALLFYRKIAALAKESFSENGVLYFEINQYLGAETAELLRKIGYANVELRKDIYGNDRMIKATYS
ncbi:MAG TPA: peptide chain release factor N(5)-glutamine methyltransferase [Flavobacterium sp.]|jgi:release factor glutamine methyltransferase